MRRATTTLATIATIAIFGSFAVACGSSSKSEGSTATPTTTAPSTSPSITITAGDYAYDGVPETIPAGLVNVKFVNEGSVAHEMGFVRVPDGTTPESVFPDLNKLLDGGPFPASFLALNGVPDTAAGKTTETQFNLTPGQYIALCTDTGAAGSPEDGAPHYARGMYKTLTVTGTGGDTPPTADAKISAHDYGFDFSGLKPGTQTVAFTNTGPKQWHFADISVFAKGTTVKQAEDAMVKILNAQGPPPPGVPSFDEVGGSQAASPGLGNTFPLTLEAGRTYVALCFIPDLAGGPPHAIAHKMYKIFTVS